MSEQMIGEILISLILLCIGFRVGQWATNSLWIGKAGKTRMYCRDRFFKVEQASYYEEE